MGTLNALYFYGYVSTNIKCLIIKFINFKPIRVLQGSGMADHTNDGGPEFAEVFVIVWIGSMVVTLNSKLLGGNM